MSTAQNPYEGHVYGPNGTGYSFDYRPSAFDKRMMNVALAEADLAIDQGEFPVGVVLAAPDSETYWKGHPDEFSHRRLNGHAERNVIEEFNQKTGHLSLRGLSMYITFMPCSGCAPTLDQGELSALHIAATRADVTKALKSNGLDPVVREYDYDLGHVIGMTPRTLMVTYGLMRAAAVERFIRKKNLDETNKPLIRNRRRNNY